MERTEPKLCLSVMAAMSRQDGAPLVSESHQHGQRFMQNPGLAEELEVRTERAFSFLIIMLYISHLVLNTIQTSLSYTSHQITHTYHVPHMHHKSYTTAKHVLYKHTIQHIANTHHTTHQTHTSILYHTAHIFTTWDIPITHCIPYTYLHNSHSHSCSSSFHVP